MCKEIRNVKINVEVQHRCPECGGFERVAPNKKKMDLTKFTVAERWD